MLYPTLAFHSGLPLGRPSPVTRTATSPLHPRSPVPQRSLDHLRSPPVPPTRRRPVPAMTSAPAPPPLTTPPSRAPRVLMVCLGNICRSPAAEAVLRAAAARRGLPVEVDSCGTGGGSPGWYAAGGFSYHEGDGGDPRMRAAAAARGIVIESASRPLAPADLEGDGAFDVVVGMDEANLRAMETARKAWVREGRCGVEEVRWRMMSEFSRDEGFRGEPVPDPYYGGVDGFEHALDLIQGAADGILDELYGVGAVGEGAQGDM